MCLERLAAACARGGVRFGRSGKGSTRQRARPGLLTRGGQGLGLICTQALLAGAGSATAWAASPTSPDLPGVESMRRQEGAAPRFPGLPSQDRAGERRTDLEAVLDALYDTNVSRSDETSAERRGLVRADERFEPRGEFDLLRPIGRQSVFLKGLVGYDLYRRDTVLNRERIDASAGFEPRIGACQGEASGRIRRQQSDLIDIVGPIAKNVNENKSVSFSANCIRDIGFSPTVGVSQTWDSNSASRKFVSDYRTLSANAGLTYSQPALGVVSLFGRYSSTRYPGRPIASGDSLVADAFETVSVGVVLDRHLGRLEGTLEVDYTRLRPNLAGARGFSGLTYAATLAANLSPRLTATADLERTTKPSIVVTASFVREDRYGGEAAYQLNSRMKVAIGGSWMRRRYEGALSAPGATLTDETITDVYVSGKFDFTRRLAFILKAGHENRNGNVAALNYDGARVGLTAVVRF